MSAPLSRPNAREHRRIVVAERAGMDLHDQAVVDAHRRHFGQHLGAEQFGVGGGELAAR